MVWGVSEWTQFWGSMGASFIEHRAKTKQRSIGSSKADMDIAAQGAIDQSLIHCLPINDHVTEKGLTQLCVALKRNDHLAAQLAIDSNPGLRKRDICIFLLKSSISYLCSEDPADLVRSATYNLIGCKK